MPLALTFQQVATIYAALVATGGLGWQIWTWRQARRPAVVRAALAVLGFDTGPEWALTIELVNHRDHVINVSSVGFVLADGRDWVAVRPMELSTLPGQVDAHDAGKLFVSLSAVEKVFDPRGPLTAWVTLATGERIRSKPVRLVAADTPAGSIAEQLRSGELRDGVGTTRRPAARDFRFDRRPGARPPAHGSLR